MAYTEHARNDFVFDITEHIGVLAEYKTGWVKELNMVAWGDAGPKYDIRDWSPDHQRMSKGITLHRDEMAKVCDLMQRREEAVKKAREAQVSVAAPSETGTPALRPAAATM